MMMELRDKISDEIVLALEAGHDAWSNNNRAGIHAVLDSATARILSIPEIAEALNRPVGVAVKQNGALDI